MMEGLNFLYKTVIGRILLRPLISRPVSVLAGKLLDSKASRILIRPFAGHHGIPMDDFLLDDIRCFNDFFCRKIKDGRRTINECEYDLIAPSDGLLSVYRIAGDTVLSVKQSSFSISRLLRDRKLASEFEGGYALVFRLCVDHYHRYVYFDGGFCHKNRRIDGFYHTVRPAALTSVPVFTENTREYTLLETDNFGRAVQMEVGAMLVGRIVNRRKESGKVTRGEEKGYFAYGGSTIIVLLTADQVTLRQDILKTLNQNTEIPVVMGETIGRKGL